MERLLKIVEGPMKGAEIALVAGTRVKVGSGEDCDIVVADSSLPAAAFELDVSEAAVTLVTPEGDAHDLQDFEIRQFGSTAVAVGPAQGAWGELFRPEPKAVEPAEPAPEDRDEGAAKEKEAAEETKEGAEPAGSGGGGAKRRGGRRLGCLVALLVLTIVAALLLVLANRFRDRLPALADRVKTAFFRRAPAAETAAVKPPPTIAEIAAAHGLRTEVRDGQTYLVGNLGRRTERMAIRAMALAADRTVRFDLTDDQSLKTAVADTLFLASGGRLTVTTVTNRVAAIAGEVSGPGELAKILKQLNLDVPQLVSCETAGVRPSVEILQPENLSPSAASAAPGPSAAGAVAKPNAPTRVPVAAAAFRPNLPVAGILTAPYPCVVLLDGSRCLEGARIGGLVLERISADELVFKTGESELKWRP